MTDIERKKIESYLSIKYGIAKATGDYIDGYGDVVRSVDADYTFGINALAKDINSKLHQRISGGTRGIVVSTDANFERANIAGDEGHTDIAGNKAFLFWADNNLDLDASISEFRTIGTDKAIKGCITFCRKTLTFVNIPFKNKQLCLARKSF